MNIRTTAKGIAEQHRLKAVSKIVIKKGGEKLLNRPPKKIIKLT